MLPPNDPGVLVATASLRAGAVARQPSISRSDSSIAGVISGASTRVVRFALSMIQFTRRGSRSARAAIDDGSTAYGASRLAEYPVIRLVSIRSIVTTMASPGSAPSI